MTLWTDNIPNANNTLAADQPNMQNNNTYLATSIAVDHNFTKNTGTTQDGYHKVIHFVNQVGDPVSVTNTGQLYTKTVNGNQQVFFENSAGNVQQLTNAPSTATFSRFGTNTNYQTASGSNSSVTGGWSYMPGGVILQYGSTTTLNPGGTVTVQLAMTFPTAVYGVVVTPNTSSSIGGGNHDWTVRSVTNSSFDLRINGNYNAGDTFYFWAYGK